MEISLENDTNVLVQLGRQDPYAYVSCMAVLPTHRRKGAASALLRAAEGLVGACTAAFAILLSCITTEQVLHFKPTNHHAFV